MVWGLEVGESSGGARFMYGAGGPAMHLLEAVTVGQNGMRDDLWRLQPEVRSLADVQCVLARRAGVAAGGARRGWTWCRMWQTPARGRS